MNWTVNCTSKKFEIKIEIEGINRCNLFNALYSINEEMISDVINDAFDAVSITPRGVFNLENLELEMCSFVRGYLTGLYQDEVFTCINIADERDVEKISILDVLLWGLRDEEYNACGGFYPRLASYIDRSLEKYVATGTWHIGLHGENEGVIYDVSNWPDPVWDNGRTKWIKNGKELYPYIWFGPEGVFDYEIRKWSVWSGIVNEVGSLKEYEQNSALVFSANILVDNFLERVITDFNYDFETWFGAECGYVIPDVDEIARECPIPLYGCTDEKEYIKKIDEFYVNIKQRS